MVSFKRVAVAMVNLHSNRALRHRGESKGVDRSLRLEIEILRAISGQIKKYRDEAGWFSVERDEK